MCAARYAFQYKFSNNIKRLTHTQKKRNKKFQWKNAPLLSFSTVKKCDAMQCKTFLWSTGALTSHTHTHIHNTHLFLCWHFWNAWKIAPWIHWIKMKEREKNACFDMANKSTHFKRSWSEMETQFNADFWKYSDGSRNRAKLFKRAKLNGTVTLIWSRKNWKISTKPGR